MSVFRFMSWDADTDTDTDKELDTVKDTDRNMNKNMAIYSIFSDNIAYLAISANFCPQL